MSVERRGTKALELWARRATDGYPGAEVTNMTTSWRNGMAFCALIHYFRPDLIDLKGLKPENILENNALAFRIAEQHLGIPALLDAEDMVKSTVPDRLSVLTYVAQYYQCFAAQGLPGCRLTPMSTPVTSPTATPSPVALAVAAAKSKVATVVPSPQTTPSLPQPKTKTEIKTEKVPAGRREMCTSCALPVFLAERLLVGATGSSPSALFHRSCFRCARCGAQLNLANYYETQKGAYCCETCPDEEPLRDVASAEGELKNKSSLIHASPEISETDSSGSSDSDDSDDDYSSNLDSALEEGNIGAETPPPPPSSEETISPLPLKPRTIFLSQTLQKGDDLGNPASSKVNNSGSVCDAVIISDVNINVISDVNKVINDVPPVVSDTGQKHLSGSCSDQSQIDSILAMKLYPELPVLDDDIIPVLETDQSNNFKLFETNDLTGSEVENSSELAIAVVLEGPLKPPRLNVIEKETIVAVAFDENSKEIVPSEVVSKFLYPPLPIIEDVATVATEPVYPDDLNPFGEDETEPPLKPVEIVQKEPDPHNPFDSDVDKTVIQQAKNLNPFGSDDEGETDEGRSPSSGGKAKPPRPPPPSLSKSSSATSSPASSISSHKKAAPSPISARELFPPASGAPSRPPPPSPSLSSTSSLSRSSRPSSPSLSGSSASIPLKLKTRKAPAPPSLPQSAPRSEPESMVIPSISVVSVIATGKVEDQDIVLSCQLQKDLKNQSNKLISNGLQPPFKDPGQLGGQQPLQPPLMAPPPPPSTPKSEGGEWQRKKGPAPPRPVPQKRAIRKLPMRQIQQELHDIEVQQTELERQGVLLEKMIRERTSEVLQEEGGSPSGSFSGSPCGSLSGPPSCLGGSPSGPSSLEAEEMILQLFELVNEKNDLFRRQTELMYLKREKRLEEEHAELEYQIRCLMLKSRADRTPQDDALEEDLIARLVRAVEQRNEIVNCLESDRLREAQEDMSIAAQMSAFHEKQQFENCPTAPPPEKKKKTLKLPKKKKKKEKKEEKKREKDAQDADKDIDETEVKVKKKKKKWFL